MWQKIAFFKLPETRPSSLISHAQAPCVLTLDEQTFRVFFATRDQNVYSHGYYVDAHCNNGTVNFSAMCETPVLSPGAIGTFDEHGVYPSSLVEHNGTHYMYYIGWNKGVEAPLFYSSVGLATSTDGHTFNKVSHAPIMARSDCDPCLVTSPNVYLDNGLWRMTYVSGVRWFRDEKSGLLQSVYHIKYAESEDGISWQRDGHVCIDVAPDETNVARSSVIKTGHQDYKMWFSYVPAAIGKYRIGFATSQDGKNWIRDDSRAGIGLDNDQAREMICYPHVFKLGDRHYMVYNGDNFGKEGFGVAVWNS